ncbi:nucleotide pyrophosphohydrolase, partial [Bacillus cereus]
MKIMGNGVLEATKLMIKAKEGQALMNNNQISELDQYQ